MNNNTAYINFLNNKMKGIRSAGIDVEQSALNPAMFEFQKHCVQKALHAGRFALFEDCGLGKTIQQLEWCDKISRSENQPVLILAPLAVTGQTIQEAVKFGYSIKRLDTGNFNLEPVTYITNYDQLDNVDTGMFAGIALDESSIIKNFEGKMRNQIIDRFRGTPFKSCWTATPSPNDPMELGNHAEFLGVMSRNEMLSMYFVHDGGNTSKWRLKGHAEDKFWQWVSTWAIMINRPSDIGYSDTGYVLPELNLIENMIETSKRNNGMLFNDMAVNATSFNSELRHTINERLDKVADMVNNSGENFIVWIRQDIEGEYLRRAIPDAVEVKGSDSPELKESRLLGFANSAFRVLVTKSKIAQHGMNWQNCHNQIFASLDFSFEALYQSIRRSHRFGQTHPVNIYLITTDTMQNVIQRIRLKQEQFNRMQQAMVNVMKMNCQTSPKQKKQSVQIQIPEFLKAV